MANIAKKSNHVLNEMEGDGEVWAKMREPEKRCILPQQLINFKCRGNLPVLPL